MPERPDLKHQWIEGEKKLNRIFSFFFLIWQQRQHLWSKHLHLVANYSLADQRVKPGANAGHATCRSPLVISAPALNPGSH